MTARTSRPRRLSILAATCALACSAAAQLPVGTVFFSEGVGSTALSAGSVSFSGTDVHSIADNETVMVNGMAFDRSKSHVYFATQTQTHGFIERINTNGTGRQTIAVFSHSGPLPQGVTIDQARGTLYWITQGGQYRIGSCGLNGSGTTGLVRYNAVLPLVSPTSIQIDSAASKMYWYDRQYQGFRRANLGGTQIENLLSTGPVWSTDVDVVNGDFYWTINTQLWRAPIDGSSLPVLLLDDPAVFTPATGKHLDVEPALDLITWTVSGGHIHFTSISNPGAIGQTLSPTGFVPNGSLEVLPGPRAHLAVNPSTISPGGTFSLDVSGVLPGGPFALFLLDWNGVPLNAFFFSAVTDAQGELSVPITMPPAITGASMHFDIWAIDVIPQLVRSLPAPLVVQ